MESSWLAAMARMCAARLRSLDLPGWAVVPDTAGAGQLQAAIAAAAAGLTALPARIPGDDDFTEDSGGRSDEGVGPVEPLTPREREVLEWLARGLSNRAIGKTLGISEHTAKFHVASVLAKLGAGNRADAVRRGIRRGLLPL